jgi:hypothetical protein
MMHAIGLLNSGTLFIYSKLQVLSSFFETCVMSDITILTKNDVINKVYTSFLHNTSCR